MKSTANTSRLLKGEFEYVVILAVARTGPSSMAIQREKSVLLKAASLLFISILVPNVGSTKEVWFYKDVHLLFVSSRFAVAKDCQHARQEGRSSPSQIHDLIS